MLHVCIPRNDTVEVLIWRYLAELKICNTDIPHSPCLCQPDKKILEATFVLPLQGLALQPYDLKVSLHHHIHSCICEFFKACQSHLCQKFMCHRILLQTFANFAMIAKFQRIKQTCKRRKN